MTQKRETQLASLTRFIARQLPAEVTTEGGAGFVSYMDSIELIERRQDFGDTIQVGILQYEAVLLWDRFPFRRCAPEKVMALLSLWLLSEANDLRDLLKLDSPSVEVELTDEETATFMISLPLADRQFLVKTPDGDIEWDGDRWQLDDLELWTAETGVLFSAENNGVWVGPDVSD